MTFVLIFI